jgi:RbcX protein
MDIKHITKATAKVLASYLTYQAVKTVLAQLSETDPPQALWMSRFSSQDKIQDGEAYLLELLEARQELAFRIMTVREHLAEEVLEFLPEMTRIEILKANTEHRRQHLEKITQFTLSDSEPTAKTEEISPEENEKL